MDFLQFNRNSYWEDYILRTDKKSRSHLVTIDLKEETVHCDCEDFKYRRQHLKFGGAKLDDSDNHCKHIKSVLKLREVLVNG